MHRARRPQQDRMLKLRRLGPFDVIQRRVILHDPLRHEIVELTPNTWSTCDAPHASQVHTASRYLLSPRRSRYRRQKGNVPKFLSIVLSSDFADVNLNRVSVRHGCASHEDAPQRHMRGVSSLRIMRAVALQVGFVALVSVDGSLLASAQVKVSHAPSPPLCRARCCQTSR